MTANVSMAAPKRRSFPWTTSLTYGVALAVAGVSIGPVLYAILGGFRSNAQINAHPAGLPSPWVWQTYGNVLTKATFWKAAANSLIIAASSTIGVTVLGVCAAFVLSRYSFRGREGLYTFFVIGLLFPATAGILPLFLLLGHLGLTDNYLGVILPQIAFGLPITIVILRPFLTAIPAELEDASAIDGASKLGFFVRVLLPLSKPALVTVAVLAFVGSWNSYALPLVILQDASLHTLPVAVQEATRSQYTQDTAAILAFTSLSMLPALLFFMFAERQIVGGLQGAVKG
jgi:raffinose/stachyose/melibiose transport system permease protein